MGTSNKRFRTARNINDSEITRQNVQTRIDRSKNIESRKKLGQFATPFQMAQEIVSYGLTLQSEEDITFLEPALGTGAFYSALLTEFENYSKNIKKAIGVELDYDFFSAAKQIWKDNAIDIINSDFTETKCFENVNLLISNPPYVRHHYIEHKKKSQLLERTKEETGYLFSGLTGLYCYFVLLAHKWLAPNAISGWLLPSEFMDVNYGDAFKQYLLNRVRLLRIHRYDPNETQFGDAVVSSCVVWFKNEFSVENYDVEFSFGGTHKNPKIIKKTDRYSLEKQRKWTTFPQNQFEIFTSSSTPTLGDFFDIKRGLATGDNDFFILSKKQIISLGLDMDFFIPILPSPRHLKCNEIFCDENGHPCMDEQYYLLNCTLPEDDIIKKSPALWSYLNSGKDTVAQKYLCKHRKVWYFQESRKPTPFLCSYMGRCTDQRSIPFRFILNHTNAIATNSYLMLYPKSDLQKAIMQKPDIIHKIWSIVSSITAHDFEKEGRIYGGGLRKIEPKELSNVRCPLLAGLLT
jgi:hypothetical protein